MEFYDLLFRFQQSKGAKDSISIYEEYYAECMKNNLHVITADKKMALNIPIFKEIMSYDNIKTIFKYPNLCFINPEIMKGMESGKEAPLAIDYSVSFEANTSRYLHDYLKYGEDKVPEKFIKTLKFLLDNNINLDPMFYILENVAKGEDSPEFYENLISIKKLMTCDMQHYNDTKKDNDSMGEIKSIYTNEKVIQDVKDEIESLKTEFKEMLDVTQKNHLIMRVLLLLIIVARFKYKNNIKQQLEYIVKFMNDKIKIMFLRELSIGVEYFEKKQLEFFNKTNNKETFFDAIDNMAWDFTVIRLLEMYFSSKPNPDADFFIPFIFTLDKGLLESIEMFYCKDFLIFKNEKRTDPIPYKSLMPKFEKYKLDKYFTVDASFNRVNSEEADFELLYKELEAEVIRVRKL